MASDITAAQAVMLFCTQHTTEEIDMYCHQCKKATCTTCMTEDHLGHKMETIAKFSRKLTNSRERFHGDLAVTYERKRRRKARKFREVKCQNDNVLSNNVKSLEERREQLHKVVDELIDKELNTCQSHNIELVEKLESIEKKHVDEYDKVEKMLTVFENTTMTGLGIIEYYQDLKTQVERMESDVDVENCYDKLVFREGEVDKKEIHRMVGEVKETTSLSRSTEMLSSFCYKQSTVQNVFPISPGQAWVVYKGNKQFMLMDRIGQHNESVPKKSENIGFIANDDNSFIHADYNDKTVLRISHSGKTTKIMNTSPLLPGEVGKALYGNILVTLFDKWSRSRTEESRRKVVMLTQGGEPLHEYEFDDDGVTPVLSFPFAPTQNLNSDVCVANFYATAPQKHKGNVCVFFEDGGLKFVYCGQREDFYPQGICCDSSCNILCIDKSDGSVHIINSEGMFMKNLFSSESSVQRPFSIALHRSVLWVGSYGGEVRVYRYQE